MNLASSSSPVLYPPHTSVVSFLPPFPLCLSGLFPRLGRTFPLHGSIIPFCAAVGTSSSVDRRHNLRGNLSTRFLGAKPLLPQPALLLCYSKISPILPFLREARQGLASLFWAFPATSIDTLGQSRPSIHSFRACIYKYSMLLFPTV